STSTSVSVWTTPLFRVLVIKIPPQVPARNILGPPDPALVFPPISKATSLPLATTSPCPTKRPPPLRNLRSQLTLLLPPKPHPLSLTCCLAVEIRPTRWLWKGQPSRL